MTYKDGQLTIDNYASNEYGEAVTHLDVVGEASKLCGCLLLVSDHYIRIYDPVRHTLRQQSRVATGIYRIELQETAPDSRWSHHPSSDGSERTLSSLAGGWQQVRGVGYMVGAAPGDADCTVALYILRHSAE